MSIARQVLIGLAVTILLAGALVLVASRWRPSGRDYPVQGIDVSHHQGAIDWQSVRA